MMSTRVLDKLDLDVILDFSLAPNDPIWSKKSLEDVLSGMLEGTYLAFVGVDEVTGQVMGYAVASYVFEQADVHSIVVSRSYRGQGMGRQLLAVLNKNLQLQGVENVFLEVRPSNQVAVNLYQSMGFVHIQKRRNYYPGVGDMREDAWVFSLEYL